MSLELSPDEYIKNRVKQYQSWYDRKAVMCKRRYLMFRAFAVIAGGTVPVLVNVQASIDNLLPYPLTRAAITIISLFVVITVSLESVFHYREQWKNYRSTEQFLGHEQYMFQTRVGRYRQLTTESAFTLFVERIEEAIATENATTLSVMAVAAETTTDRRSDR